jgi:hypothetical protein
VSVCTTGPQTLSHTHIHAHTRTGHIQTHIYTHMHALAAGLPWPALQHAEAAERAGACERDGGCEIVPNASWERSLLRLPREKPNIKRACMNALRDPPTRRGTGAHTAPTRAAVADRSPNLAAQAARLSRRAISAASSFCSTFQPSTRVSVLKRADPGSACSKARRPPFCRSRSAVCLVMAALQSPRLSTSFCTASTMAFSGSSALLSAWRNASPASGKGTISCRSQVPTPRSGHNVHTRRFSSMQKAPISSTRTEQRFRSWVMGTRSWFLRARTWVPVSHSQQYTQRHCVQKNAPAFSPHSAQS